MIIARKLFSRILGGTFPTLPPSSKPMNESRRDRDAVVGEPKGDETTTGRDGVRDNLQTNLREVE